MQHVQEVLFSGFTFMRFRSAARLLEAAIEERAFPAAVIEVGDTTQPLWRQAFGRLTFDADAAATREDTIFDLASLTKVLATTGLVMQQLERGAIGLDDPVARHVGAWEGADRSAATVHDLLSHASGLAAYVPFYRDRRGRAEFERAICASPLEYPPRTKSVYSDLGFMLLGFILEDVGRASTDHPTLARRFQGLLAQMGVAEDLQFHPPAVWRARTAPTEIDPWRGRLLVGEVHDENCAALGGAAAHSGLFGTAAASGACARHLLQILDGRVGAFRRETVELFVARRTDVPDSSRALGWDTMLPTSSCGSRMSPRAFGHTGFTGTSLWIDPERRIYVVLLTNRVHPTRAHEAIRRVRPSVHDAVVEDYDSGAR
ncbi:MAG: beta-lactamase family protein [Acidobacteria bacterium]|nr:beta-lactamase family protein [Acidobacteriota bacterium]